MGKKFLLVLAIVSISFSMVGVAGAVVIDFTGGNAHLWNGSTVTTDTSATYYGVDYYEEDGFILDFLENNQNNTFTSIIGDYYGGGNDVIHGHWATGRFGDLTAIKISATDGSNFDLNYFELTSNTDTGGQPASGNEKAYITAYDASNAQIGSSVLLPSDDWGWSGSNPSVLLGSDFDAVSYVMITAGNQIDCFGMDMFYINEAAPPHPAPEPSTLLLMGIGLLGLVGYSRKRSKKS